MNLKLKVCSFTGQCQREVHLLGDIKMLNESNLFGEKHRLLIVSTWSRVYKCFPSLRSQSIALASLPPDAQREPSGDMVTVFKYPV